MKLKICGVSRPVDAERAFSLGAAYIGVILSPGFARSQTTAAAHAIYAAAGTAQRVGVFVDASIADILNAVQKLALDIVQLHGQESVAFIDELRAQTTAKTWKAVRVKSGQEALAAYNQYEAHVAAVLID